MRSGQSPATQANPFNPKSRREPLSDGLRIPEMTVITKAIPRLQHTPVVRLYCLGRAEEQQQPVTHGTCCHMHGK